MAKHGILLLCVGAFAAAQAIAAAAPADLVVTEARIYTAAPDQPIAQALAVKDGRVVFVGSAADARPWIGPATRVKRMGGQLVLPGFVDAHIHPLDIIDLDVCDLASKARSLRQISAFVQACLKRYRIAAGGWLHVESWNYTNGNQPDSELTTLRAALDHASTQHRIVLNGNDGHHGAFNSRALADAKNAQGTVVGLSRATLASDFAAYRHLIGVDAAGEPDGMVNEDARYFLAPDEVLGTDYAAVMKAPERITERLNSVGITAMMDAEVPPESLAVYDALLARSQLTVRTTLAQFYDPERYRAAGGKVDFDAMVAQAVATRAKYADHALIRADEVKLFADGVAEGNPYAVPPTLPNSPALKPYLQPSYALDASGRASVTGYVDTDSALCRDTRAALGSLDPAAMAAFRKAHGFHPAQCQSGSGELQHDRDTILEFVRRFHLAGFSVHIHAIGDRAVRTAVEAIAAARAADGNRATRDGLAHAQLVHPDDVARIGREKLFIAFTYAWNIGDAEYDTTIVPFFVKVSGNSFAQMHPAGSYYDAAIYPVKSVLEAGGVITGGSDAPVETRDPRPLVNIARAVTRRRPGGPVLTPDQRITIRQALDSYTINAARAIGWERQTGSLEAGKSADFIVLNRDILKLAESGHAEAIEKARVVETWFAGRNVYRAPRGAAPKPQT
jgi:predicted amidohydrolase YtcJ